MIQKTYTPLLTDLYQLTMACGYYKLGMQDQHAVFHLFFRNNPFKGNYALSCGLQNVIEFLQEWHFTDNDVDYLASLKTRKNTALFPIDFLNYLKNLKFTCHVDAVPEGTILFPHEPMIRIEGPILQCQIIESPLLNILNFQTLIATKATRVCRAAGDHVIEFGLRRAQGPDGALSASRAAYIGGCEATSNTLAGKMYDIPVRGTHAHSWVSAFPSELEAFKAYAEVMPDNCVLLVDTYNTVKGVQHAIEVGKKLREVGSDLLGIRLDSGDITELSKKARKLLDDAGFQTTQIMASNTLDEYIIEEIKEAGGAVTFWGVGTHLVTAYESPALDGVYKISGLKKKEGEWEYKLKLSEQEIKNSNPGIHQIRRFFCNDQYVTDVIYDINFGIQEAPEPHLLDNKMQKIRLDDCDGYVDLLQPIMRNGEIVADVRSIHKIREEAIMEVDYFYRSHHGRVYPVGLDKKLYDFKKRLMDEVRNRNL